MGIIRFTFNNT